jgi:hypothetical protein
VLALQLLLLLLLLLRLLWQLLLSLVEPRAAEAARTRHTLMLLTVHWRSTTSTAAAAVACMWLMFYT